MKTFRFLPLVVLIWVLLATVAYGAPSFKDVSDKHWAHEEIAWGIAQGIISGYPDGSFRPNDTITFKEFVSILIKAYEDPSSFIADKDQPWDSKTRSYALHRWGYYTSQERPMTRGEVALLTAAAQGFNCSEDQSIQFLLNEGMSRGKTSPTIEGYGKDDLLTRAEAITFIKKMKKQLEYLSDKPPYPSPNCPVPGSSDQSDIESGPFTQIQTMTNTSVISLTAQFNIDSNFEIIINQNGERLYYQSVDTINGRLNTKIYLHNGTGKYVVSIKPKGSGSTNVDFGNREQLLAHGYAGFTVMNSDQRSPDLISSSYVNSDDPEIIGLARSIAEGKANDYDKTKAIHDWVTQNIAYDTVAYFSGDIQLKTAMEALLNKKALCNGYAHLTAALNRAIGIPTRIHTGTVKGIRETNAIDTSVVDSLHTWIETYVDGKWIIQDTTWDAGYLSSSTNKFVFQQSDRYFDPSPEMFALDHQKIRKELY
ncbi:hypothetical protein BSK59_28875 [Paenibacillus odorifer]|uniref:transglutaminase domain-containing protein n=1 Tax=Paenibacillus odorifer TaxID=189426 RepID=UPI00096CCF6D|nr:transglutaminase domain-containing protein [Paenibacillus odorifer]OME46859.1 hypothetical protein BSK59_28875 [Paenibacillus odorifer]